MTGRKSFLFKKWTQRAQHENKRRSRKRKGRLLYMEWLLPCYCCQGNLESLRLTHYVHFSSVTAPLPFLVHVDCERRRMIRAANHIFKYGIRSKLKCKDFLLLLLSDISLHALMWTTLGTLSTSILPLTPTREQRFSTSQVIIPIICYQRENWDIIQVKHKMVAWYSDSFPWLQTTGTKWKVKILDREHGVQAPSCGWFQVLQHVEHEVRHKNETQT